MSKILLRFFSGLLNGIIGSIIFIIFSLSIQDILKSTPDQVNTPLSFDTKYIFIIISIFVTTIVLCLLMNLFYYLTDREKYPFIKSSLVATLSGNIALEVIIVPLYMLYGLNSLGNLYTIILLQLVSFILLTQLITESLATYRNMLAQSFSAIISIMISILLITLISKVSFIVVIFSTPLILLSLVSLGSGISDLYPEIRTNEIVQTIKANKKNKALNPEEEEEEEEENEEIQEIDLAHDYTKDPEKF